MNGRSLVSETVLVRTFCLNDEVLRDCERGVVNKVETDRRMKMFSALGYTAETFLI